jgi:hypothetical protein
MKFVRRWWYRCTGAPLRAFARYLSAGLLDTTHDGIRLMIGDRTLALDAQRFFAHTKDALRYAAEDLPERYWAFQQQVETIVLTSKTITPAYNPFQLTVLAPVNLLDVAVPEYAAWLLDAAS